ncbi:MAG: dihydrofolate reductase [bacterium]|nr:dihydrofolate reductase [bacterium]
MNPRVSMIAAIGRNRELGKNNRLLWSIPEDTRHFRALTKGHVVIMGRRTFESIGRPLPNRTNIVISRKLEKQHDQVLFYQSLDDALRRALEIESSRQDGIGPEVFIIGGGQIYAEALPFSERLYLTIVEGTFEADTFFPDYEKEFDHVVSKETKSDDHFTYTFLTLERSGILKSNQ